MSATNFTPIQLYRTTTASAVPTAGNLAAGELAINLTDEKLFFKNAAGTVKLLASTDTLGTVTSVAASGGTTGLTFSGSPITTSGTLTLGGTLGVANGGTGTSTAFTAGSVVFAGASGVYTQDNANLFWDNSNDRLGIGTASPAQRLDVSGSANSVQARFGNVAGRGLTIGTTTVSGTNDAGVVFNAPTTEGSFIFQTVSTERMRIDSSGNLLVGRTAGGSGTGFEWNTAFGGYTLTSSTGIAGVYDRIGSDGQIIQFRRSGTEVGNISVTTTATAYNTSSDYRLKEIDGPIVNSGAYIDALKPVQGSWKADGSRFIGLLAHEVQEVSETPIATGEKDGEEMQAMDYSAPELIANLIAEIQSLRARVAQLEGN